jgi:hypothetical protein
LQEERVLNLNLVDDIPYFFINNLNVSRKTLSLTVREECRPSVFEIRMPRKILRPKRDEVTGEWRRLHNDYLHDWHSSPNIIQMVNLRGMKWAGYVARKGEKRVTTEF